MTLTCWMGEGGTARGGFETAVWNAFFLTSTRTTVHPLCLCEKDSVISSPGCNPLSAENLPQPPLSMHEYCRTSSFTGQYLPLRASSRVALSLSFTSVSSKCGVIHLLGTVRVVFGPQAEGGSTFSSGRDGSVFPRSGYRCRYWTSCSAMLAFDSIRVAMRVLLLPASATVHGSKHLPTGLQVLVVSIHPRTSCRPSTVSRGGTPRELGLDGYGRPIDAPTEKSTVKRRYEDHGAQRKGHAEPVEPGHFGADRGFSRRRPTRGDPLRHRVDLGRRLAGPCSAVGGWGCDCCRGGDPRHGPPRTCG